MAFLNKIFLFKDDKVGSEPLGEKMAIKCLEAILENLEEESSIDSKIICLNRGVLLCSNSAESSEDSIKRVEILKKLEKLGVEILCCGTCIDALGVKLIVGKASNAKDIMKNLLNNNTITF